MRIAFAICGALLTVSLFVAAMHDTTRERRPILDDYMKLAAERADSDHLKSAIANMDTGIKQDFLPALDRTDRCRTCHLGIDNPSMKGAPQPHAAHSGKLLEQHPPEKFGCTVCHQGQGLATTTVAAHANDIKFWEEPMLAPPYIEATCEQCHRGAEIKGATVLNDGRRLFARKGCAGCHKVYGKGGALGPDLTNLGVASTYLKHPIQENMEEYLALVGGNMNLAYILESLRSPGAQPETTTMPVYSLSDWELKALSVYIKSLTDADLPVAFKAQAKSPPPHVTGQQMFIRYCSACHGDNGEGGMRIGRMGTTLNNQGFLGLASPEFIGGIIRSGRNSKNKVMPSWREGAGGLTDAEIEGLLEYMLSWKAPSPEMVQVLATRGVWNNGNELYQRACADCHGKRREGKIGPSLLSAELSQIASTRFLYDVLVAGRPGTAMPAWNDLTDDQLESLMSLLESHERRVTTSSNVWARGDRATGRKAFLSHCATCHGREGQGGIGPSVANPELVALADDAFIIKTVVDGRRDSGMPSWSELPVAHLSAVAAYLRTITAPATLGTIPAGAGDVAIGKEISDGVCSKCHGNDGEGGTGPGIGSADFLNVASDWFLAGTIKFGRDGTEMKPHGLVRSAMASYTDEEISGVVSYLRTLGSKPVIRQTIRGSVDGGRQWYNMVCVNCHGDGGRGGTGPALANPYFLETVSDGFLQAQMALGRTGTEMRPMTPYAGGLVEIERSKINDIIAYLRHRSLTYGTEERPVQTAFGMVPHGANWFSDVCSKCHGTGGRGTVAAPGLNDANFLRYATDGFVQGTIIRGRMHTGMRAFGEHGDGIASLSAADVTDVTAYIHSWSDPSIGVAPEPITQISTRAVMPVLKQDSKE